MNIIQKYIINLAKRWVYIEYRQRELVEMTWEDQDRKNLREFNLTETGKKLQKILINAEIYKMNEVIANDKGNREYRIGSVCGATSVRSQILSNAMEQKKQDEVEPDLTIEDLNNVIQDRILGYNNRRYEA